MMGKECSAEEARIKAEAYCSVSEHCRADVLRTIPLSGVSMEDWEGIVRHLEEEKYVDDGRYALAFVRDKYRFNQWGRVKIAQALRMKQVPSACIAEALEEIDEEEYLSILTALLRRKQRSVKAASDYERKGKLIRFAAGHGYEMEDILQCMKQIGLDDEYME